MTDLDDLVRSYLDVCDRLDALTAHRDQLKAELRHLGEGRHDCLALDAVVTVSAPMRRFNPARFSQVVTDEELATACTETIVSPKKAKAILPPAVYDMCCSESGEPRVSVR